MSKCKILVTIVNKEENISYEANAILQDNIIKYRENNNTVVIYDYEKNILLRENEDLRMNYPFDLSRNTKGTIEIKEIGRKLNIPIQTKNIERKKNSIEIQYTVEENEFLYKIEEIK